MRPQDKSSNNILQSMTASIQGQFTCVIHFNQHVSYSANGNEPDAARIFHVPHATTGPLSVSLFYLIIQPYYII
jgi:hypothetical protein